VTGVTIHGLLIEKLVVGGFHYDALASRMHRERMGLARGSHRSNLRVAIHWTEDLNRLSQPEAFIGRFR